MCNLQRTTILMLGPGKLSCRKWCAKVHTTNGGEPDILNHLNKKIATQCPPISKRRPAAGGRRARSGLVAHYPILHIGMLADKQAHHEHEQTTSTYTPYLHPNHADLHRVTPDLQQRLQTYATVHLSRSKCPVGAWPSPQLFPAWSCFGNREPCKPALCLPAELSACPHTGRQVRQCAIPRLLCIPGGRGCRKRGWNGRGKGGGRHQGSE